MFALFFHVFPNQLYTVFFFFFEQLKFRSKQSTVVYFLSWQDEQSTSCKSPQLPCYFFSFFSRTQRWLAEKSSFQLDVFPDPYVFIFTLTEFRCIICVICIMYVLYVLHICIYLSKDDTYRYIDIDIHNIISYSI